MPSGRLHRSHPVHSRLLPGWLWKAFEFEIPRRGQDVQKTDSDFLSLPIIWRRADGSSHWRCPGLQVLPPHNPASKLAKVSRCSEKGRRPFTAARVTPLLPSNRGRGSGRAAPQMSPCVLEGRSQPRGPSTPCRAPRGPLPSSLRSPHQATDASPTFIFSGPKCLHDFNRCYRVFFFFFNKDLIFKLS